MVLKERNGRFMNGTIILDFGSKSCRPCIVMDRFLESVVSEYPEIELIKIDVEKEPDVASQFQVKGIPQLIFLQSGKEKSRLSGGHGNKRLKEFIDECMSKS